MTLFRNLILFFLVFLPTSCTVGIAANWFVGPISPPRVGFEIMHFELWVVPLFLPSIAAVPILHFFYRYRARDSDTGSLRRLAIVATPIALLAVHLVIFGTSYWSLPLLVLYAVPGALYGACFGIVRRKQARA